MTEPTRKLIGADPRVETGVVQFGDDWPGVFIRGDNCAYYAYLLNDALHLLDTVDAPDFNDVMVRAGIAGLRDLLAGSRIRGGEHGSSD